MALSPNYGWSEPDNSSLVKNGAADIRTLGDAIDNAVWNVGYSAGKNKIINGDFRINQRRANTFTTTSTFIADRFDSAITGDGTVTFSRQAFTPGTAPLASYEGTDYVQIVTTGQTTTGSQARLRQKIESVRQLANQPVTISFWAKAATGTPFIAAYISQSFGTGGSPSSAVDTAFGKKAISTSWARYSFTATLPSISGKTLGTDNNDVLNFGIIVSAGSDFNTAFSSIGIQSNTFSIWGLQVEAGSVASAFQTASGSIAGELALAQRYYQRIQATSTSTFVPFSMALGASTTQAKGIIESMVTLRNVPSTVDFGGTIIATDGVTNTTITTVTIDAAGSEKNLINFGVASGLTQFRPYVIRAQSDSTAFIGLSAEL